MSKSGQKQADSSGATKTKAGDSPKGRVDLHGNKKIPAGADKKATGGTETVKGPKRTIDGVVGQDRSVTGGPAPEGKQDPSAGGPRGIMPAPVMTRSKAPDGSTVYKDKRGGR